ncbi:MAG TPA: AAA family ATPase [Burkholderiales bacterium]|nr:AAA family ATPase [Burkholderiales bacterium]
MEGDPGRILAALREPRSYPRGADRVEVIETHISRVYLAGNYAYKVKKPVTLGFLDFGTLAARRFFCEEELRLNRRTAPELYLGVVPIVEAPGGVRAGGEGEPLEYAVEMRRFPQEALADGLARRGELGARQIDAIAEAIAAFHASIPAATGESCHGSPERAIAPALANFERLGALGPDDGETQALGELRAWTRRESERLRDVFAARGRDGFVRECHGDLHLGNIAVLEGGPVLFDCIEFDPALRWIDVMNEAAFLAMDLLEHGLAAVAWRFLNAYLDATGDHAGVRVLRYYLVYRAMVRAMVARIREHQPGSAAAQGRAHREFGDYLALALSLCKSGAPALMLMHGLSGSGKTTVSQTLLEELGAVRVRSDVERKRLHGLAAGARTHAVTGGGIYAAESTRLTYGRLAQAARAVVESGHRAIVDAAFLRRSERDAFRALARELGAPFLIVSCEAPEDVLRERVLRREAALSDASEAGVAVLERQLASHEPLSGSEVGGAVRIETARGEAAIAEAIPEIAGRLAAQ